MDQSTESLITEAAESGEDAAVASIVSAVSEGVDASEADLGRIASRLQIEPEEARQRYDAIREGFTKQAADRVTLVPLPPRAPELNPVENVWQFLRENWLSNRVFHSYDDIVAHCCDAWNKLTDQPWRIITLGMRNWAHGC